jgi:hypothetical protein
LEKAMSRENSIVHTGDIHATIFRALPRYIVRPAKTRRARHHVRTPTAPLKLDIAIIVVFKFRGSEIVIDWLPAPAARRAIAGKYGRTQTWTTDNTGRFQVFRVFFA